ncbi:MAG: transporter, partial [Jatrophihabitantaceae bacterium]|nr:transporter [Jatrophihabitantaceae bacterium]
VGTAVLSTLSASAAAGYLADHASRPGAADIAATHGYVVAFAVGSGLFAVGAVVSAMLFPSKAGIAALRAAAART